MLAAAPLATEQAFDSVKSILTELNDNYQQQSEIRETLVAKGVPVATINMLVNFLETEAKTEFDNLSSTAKKMAYDKYGASAVKHDELQQGVTKLTELEEDALYVRRIAKGMGLNAQALSMLTNIIRQNPGDGGKRVLTLLFEYAADYGIKLEGLRVIEVGAAESKQSVLPDVVVEEQNGGGFLKYKDIFLELVMAAIVTYVALLLLT